MISSIYPCISCLTVQTTNRPKTTSKLVQLDQCWNNNILKYYIHGLDCSNEDDINCICNEVKDPITVPNPVSVTNKINSDFTEVLETNVSQKVKEMRTKYAKWLDLEKYYDSQVEEGADLITHNVTNEDMSSYVQHNTRRIRIYVRQCSQAWCLRSVA